MDDNQTKNKENITFPMRLKTLRMQKSISQRKFAELIDLNYSQYNRYEKGDRKPSTETLTKLANALDVSVGYLLDGTEQDAAVANFADKEFLKIFEEAEKLADEDKEVIKKLLNAFLMQKRLQKELAS